MRMITFANRTFKEIIRDPLTVAFGLGFPLVVLLLLTAIQANVPVALFELDKLTPAYVYSAFRSCRSSRRCSYQRTGRLRSSAGSSRPR